MRYRTLDEPASKYLPELATFPVLVGFGRNGRAILRRVRSAPTLRQLLSHTSGFAYATWSPNMMQYETHHGNEREQQGEYCQLDPVDHRGAPSPS